MYCNAVVKRRANEKSKFRTQTTRKLVIPERNICLSQVTVNSCVSVILLQNKVDVIINVERKGGYAKAFKNSRAYMSA